MWPGGDAAMHGAGHSSWTMQPFEPILFWNFSTFSPFILGSPGSPSRRDGRTDADARAGVLHATLTPILSGKWYRN